MHVTYDFYGKPGDLFTYDHTENLWSYVSHFLRPFYVYAYAFGELFTESLFAVQDKFGDDFEGSGGLEFTVQGRQLRDVQGVGRGAYLRDELFRSRGRLGLLRRRGRCPVACHHALLGLVRAVRNDRSDAETAGDPNRKSTRLRIGSSFGIRRH